MTKQNAAPSPVDDPFAQAVAEKPGCKLARVIDRTLGVEFILAFAPGSRYFDFDRQTMEIARTGVPAIANLIKAPAA
jgi:hypothetical protein